MYYIWSFVASIATFGVIQYNDYVKNPKKYNLYTAMNVVTFSVIFLLMSILFYFVFEIDYKCVNKIQKGGNRETFIDPTILRKIPDNIYTGFKPFDNTEL